MKLHELQGEEIRVFDWGCFAIKVLGRKHWMILMLTCIGSQEQAEKDRDMLPCYCDRK